MKKLLICILSATTLNIAFANVGSVPNKPMLSRSDDDVFMENYDNHNFYTVIINNSDSTAVDIYSKNAMHWKNYGWCDGDSSGKISVPPGEHKVYCGGTSPDVDYTWSDMPRYQHEWWFHQNGVWKQNFSEQWLAVTNPRFNLTRVVEGNDWNRAYEFTPFMYRTGGYSFNSQKVSTDYVSSIYDYISKILPPAISMDSIKNHIIYNQNDDAGMNLTMNSVIIYTINKEGTAMTAECYSLPVKFSSWEIVDELRVGINLCPNKVIKINQ